MDLAAAGSLALPAPPRRRARLTLLASAATAASTHGPPGAAGDATIVQEQPPDVPFGGALPASTGCPASDRRLDPASASTPASCGPCPPESIAASVPASTSRGGSLNETHSLPNAQFDLLGAYSCSVQKTDESEGSFHVTV